MHLISRLNSTPKEELTGTELYVLPFLEKNDIGFFPLERSQHMDLLARLRGESSSEEKNTMEVLFFFFDFVCILLNSYAGSVWDA